MAEGQSRSNLWGYAGSFLAGAVIGGRIMYMLDPDAGTRRRRYMQDKTCRFFRIAADAADKSVRDMKNRARGVIAQSLRSVRAEDVSDPVLEERVRSKLGRIVSHPGAIDVSASQGTVRLRGRVLERELDQLLPQLYKIRGGRRIESQFEVHQEASAHPDLQGGRESSGPLPEWKQQRWSPTARVIAGSAGVTALRVAWTAGALGFPLALAGSGFLLRALTNKPVRGALGVTRDKSGIELEKTMEIQAPVEQVYGFWANPESFSRIMSHVKEVKKIGDGLYHWTVSGPAGVSVSWDAVITKQIPNKLIAWESVPGSTVQNAGIARFQSSESGGTRIHIRISYNPIGGIVSHALASLFGSDPKTALDEDFVLLQSFFERGKTTAHGESIRPEQLHV
jgi:uncharacterized membrane protein